MNHPDYDRLEALLKRRLEPLREAPERNPAKAVQGHSAFLAQAKRIATTRPRGVPVSVNAPSRLNQWMKHIRNPFNREERYSMFSAISSILVILALVFGGAGATVYAAQGSLPDQVLYPIKTVSEDVQLALARQAQNRLELALSFADRRVDEMLALRAAGESIPPETATRLENHIRLALQIAAGMHPDQLSQALHQIRTHLARQERLMEMAQKGAAGADEPLLQQVRLMLREQNRLIEQGLQEPARFRYQMQLQFGDPAVIPSPAITGSAAAVGNSYGPGPGASLGTPSCGECTPVMDGTGPGPGPGPLEYGKTPEPGQGPGSGPEPQPTPQPAGGGNDDGNGGSPTITQEPDNQNGGAEQGGDGSNPGDNGGGGNQGGGSRKP